MDRPQDLQTQNDEQEKPSFCLVKTTKPRAKKMPLVLRRRLEAEEESKKQSNKKQRATEKADDFDADITVEPLTAQASEQETPPVEPPSAWPSRISVVFVSESDTKLQYPSSSQLVLDANSAKESPPVQAQQDPESS
ncbi:Herc2 [Symbiodinium sp. CCMP2592]|nr:Herc2 [Symbiodinium sp. CCMP2592]